MKRNVTLRIGDWSDDGHGKYSDVEAIVEGNDVNDEQLMKNLKKFEEDSGVVVSEICESYEDWDVDAETLKAILKTGIKLDTSEGSDGPVIGCENLSYLDDSFREILAEGYDGEFYEEGFSFDAAAFLLAVFGYGDESYSYEIKNDERDFLVGGYGAALKSFGYGLFL